MLFGPQNIFMLLSRLVQAFFVSFTCTLNLSLFLSTLHRAKQYRRFLCNLQALKVVCP